MKGFGNYRELPTAVRTQVERRRAQLVLLQGPRASVQFTDGAVYTWPAEPFRKLNMQEGALFVLVTTYAGKRAIDYKIEVSEARGNAVPKAHAKVYVRDGLKVTTRKP